MMNFSFVVHIDEHHMIWRQIIAFGMLDNFDKYRALRNIVAYYIWQMKIAVVLKMKYIPEHNLSF